jgi:hypothetical protein
MSEKGNAHQSFFLLDIYTSQMQSSSRSASTTILTTLIRDDVTKMAVAPSALLMIAELTSWQAWARFAYEA